jgi:transcriptional regulator with XRE-family HTH domain
MSIGYTRYLIEANREAPVTLGVQLGRWAIRNNVPVSQVAKRFGVSRQTVYNWFIGKHEPSESLAKPIRYYIRKKS